MDGSMDVYSVWSRWSYLTQAKKYWRETNKTKAHIITTKVPFGGMWALGIEIKGEIRKGQALKGDKLKYQVPRLTSAPPLNLQTSKSLLACLRALI
jgi:hypothetical protein